MATDLNVAAEAAQRLAAQFAGLQLLGDALAHLGSIDQALRDGKTRLDKMQAEGDKVAAGHAARLAALDGELRSAQAGIDAAKAQAQDILAKAKSAADAMHAAALDSVDEALTAAAEKEAAITDRVLALEERAAELDSAVKGAEERLANAQKALAKLAAKLGD